MRQNKYHNIKIEVDGVKYDSKKEYLRFLDLCILEGNGIIKDLQRQKKFLIVPKKGNNRRERFYIADFVYTENNQKVIEDVKSPITKKNPVYTLKKALVLWQYPEYIFKEY